MSKKSVVYRLESQATKGAAWEPVRDRDDQPITWMGYGSKSQALIYASLLLRYPSFEGLRVMKRGSSEAVKTWVKKARRDAETC